MNNDIIKRKNELMKSIMMNPKLSRSFKDAMNAPIGSTKRDHAKSILSIMKKVGGLRNDGMGGPVMGMGMPAQQPKPSVPATPNYSNMVIFPAAPKFKVKQKIEPQPVKKQNAFDGAGGLYDGKGGPFDNLNPTFNFNTTPTNTYKNLASSIKLPSTTPNNTGLNITGNAGSNQSFSGITPLPITSPNKYNLTLPSTTKTVSTGLTQGNQPITSNVPAPKTTTSTYNPGGNTQTSDVALTPGQFNTQTGEKIQTGGTSGITGPKVDTTKTTSGPSYEAPIPTVPTTQMSEGARLKAEAGAAVKEGTGAGMFAMGAANEKFGGSLDQYIADLDTKLKKDFNLEPLENELSDLKAMKGNLVPTLTNYINGKDQYLKFIDQMIDKSEGDLLGVDMSDPASVERYNNNMNYLYTLKGRQSQRYGNFLNSAISDYNAELEQTQNNYNNIYERYSDAITRQGTIAQNEYNTLYTAMADLYKNLEEAPIKRANLEALELQNMANRITIAQNALTNGSTTNPDYWKDVKTYMENIADKDGNLSAEVLGEGGLPGLFAKLAYSGGDPYAMAEAVNTAMAKSLVTGGLPKLKEFKTLVNDLYAVEGGADLASMLTPSLQKNAIPLVSSYVLNNLDQIKKATNQLVSGTAPWFSRNKKPGLTNKEEWMKDFAGVDQGILEDLYNTAKVNITPGSEYEKNPSTFAATLLSGSDDKTIANNLASSLLSF